ncbi:unnamed protein product [Linum trigynum]|uniref:Uncharacterized protein n=1 Tax=Linum trigynum TaxID=586398 RepID=A0AAV2GQV5_9ROSI
MSIDKDEQVEPLNGAMVVKARQEEVNQNLAQQSKRIRKRLNIKVPLCELEKFVVKVEVMASKPSAERTLRPLEGRSSISTKSSFLNRDGAPKILSSYRIRQDHQHVGCGKLPNYQREVPGRIGLADGEVIFQTEIGDQGLHFSMERGEGNELVLADDGGISREGVELSMLRDTAAIQV